MSVHNTFMTENATINEVQGFCSLNRLASAQDEQDPACLHQIIKSLQADNARMAQMLSEAKKENDRMRAQNARIAEELAKGAVPVDALTNSLNSSPGASPGPSRGSGVREVARMWPRSVWRRT